MRRDELRDGLSIASRLLEAAEVSPKDRDEWLLLSYASDLEGAASTDLERLDVLFAGALRGFLRCAAAGERLETPAHLGEGFEDAVDANYPGAGAAFRRLAVSYWTLKMLEARIAERYAGILLQQVLRDVVEKVEVVFFAEPSPERPVEDLATGQRALLDRACAPIDAEELLHGNPLLVGNPLA